MLGTTAIRTVQFLSACPGRPEEIPRKWDNRFPVFGVPIVFHIVYALCGNTLQRLFSTFASGWPGFGLLLLRVLTCVALIHYRVAGVHEASAATIITIQLIGVVAGLLLLAGLWTPVAGVLAAIINLWIAVSYIFSGAGDPWNPTLEAVLGAALAMLGPGAWSIDSRLYGRKRIDIPKR